MHRTVMVVGALLAGCGSSGDDCETFVNKTSNVMGKSLSSKVTDEQKKRGIEECRKDPSMRSSQTFKCVLAAGDAAAIHKCFGLKGDESGAAPDTNPATGTH